MDRLLLPQDVVVGLGFSSLGVSEEDSYCILERVSSTASNTCLASGEKKECFNVSLVLVLLSGNNGK